VLHVASTSPRRRLPVVAPDGPAAARSIAGAQAVPRRVRRAIRRVEPRTNRNPLTVLRTALGESQDPTDAPSNPPPTQRGRPLPTASPRSRWVSLPASIWIASPRRRSRPVIDVDVATCATHGSRRSPTAHVGREPRSVAVPGSMECFLIRGTRARRCPPTVSRRRPRLVAVARVVSAPSLPRQHTSRREPAFGRPSRRNRNPPSMLVCDRVHQRAATARCA
jgi:hypothetical protein